MNTILIIAIAAIVIMGVLCYLLQNNTLNRYERLKSEKETLQVLHVKATERIDKLNESLASVRSTLVSLEKQHQRDGADLIALAGENRALNDAYQHILSRIVTVSREVPSDLVSSKKAERLMVNIRQFMKDEGDRVSVQIVTEGEVNAEEAE